jgi:hypothetical protein
MYAGGMPIMFWFAYGYCVTSYWADKIMLLWNSHQPPQYPIIIIINPYYYPNNTRNETDHDVFAEVIFMN